MQTHLEQIIRDAWGRSLATLIRLSGDFDDAENALQEACVIAWQNWSSESVPANPSAWLIATARHKLLDARKAARRRDARETAWWTAHVPAVGAAPEVEIVQDNDLPIAPVDDDRLRLIFTCCHPSLAPEAQIALTLRTLSGLTTEEIARAFLVDPKTMAQRLVRAKRKIRSARIPYLVPTREHLAERLGAVISVLYLIFNEGYAASVGPSLLRTDLADEAIRLTRVLVAELPQAERPRALLALMLLHHARRAARVAADGEPVLLEEQDRTLWDAAQIREGIELTDRLVREGGESDLTLEAAIAALHARAGNAQETPWSRIAALYELRYRLFPSPVVALNRAVAIAMADSLDKGLEQIEQIERSGQLRDYHLLPAARAGLLWRSGRYRHAAEAYAEAIAICRNESELKFLQRRWREATERAGLID